MRKTVFCAVVAAFLCAQSGAQTIGDLTTEAEASLELMQKQKQIEDMQAADPLVSRLPSVISTMEFGAKKFARLKLASGSVMTFNQGDEITDRMRLHHVGPRRVEVSIEPLRGARGKKPVIMALDFVSVSNQNGFAGGGLPSAGTPVGPVPEALRMAPPPIPEAGAIPWSGGASPVSVQ